MAPPRRATARTAALPARRPGLALRRFLPSPRSLAVGLALIALTVGAYAAARETSMFSLRQLAITGGTPELQQQVSDALGPELGRSLVAVQAADVERRLADVAGVLSVRIDRDFPHTLRVILIPERPVLVLRRGKDAWLVSARGRVLRKLADPRPSSLPRIWVPKDTSVKLGKVLAPEGGGTAALVLAPVVGSDFPAQVQSVRAEETELTLVLRSGLELRLGDPGDLRLKLAVARKLLLLEGADSGAAYMDVSVPERPVVGGGNTQVEGEA